MIKFFLSIAWEARIEENGFLKSDDVKIFLSPPVFDIQFCFLKTDPTSATVTEATSNDLASIFLHLAFFKYCL